MLFSLEEQMDIELILQMLMDCVLKLKNMLKSI
jgi:hypothetical protein